jgi:hypothetical protein
MTKIPINFDGCKTDQSTTDGKTHTSIIAQNLHRPDKHHHLLLTALALIAAFRRRIRSSKLPVFVPIAKQPRRNIRHSAADIHAPMG